MNTTNKTRIMILPSICSLLFTSSTQVLAFRTPVSDAAFRIKHGARAQTTFLQRAEASGCRAMLPPDLHHAVDCDSLNVVGSHLSDLFQASSMLLADASDATVDAAGAVVETAKDGGGWWQAYLNVFKNSLLWVHGRVDGPLRNVGITETWGPSIALFTACVRGALIPLSIQQSKSTERVKALQPYQAEIKEKFKDNQDMQNRAMAKLFEDSGTNPLAGCLVSLAQLPIFIGLYRSVTLLAKDGQLAESFLWIPNLAGPVSPPNYRGMEWLTEGWTTDGSFPVPALGWETTLAFLIMPVVLVIGQSITMSVLSPKNENATEKEKEEMEKSQLILKLLPLMIGYFSLQVPAGLTIYWFTSNLFTVSQSLLVRAYYAANPPNIELPEYWDALDDMDSMTPEEKRQAAEAGIATGPKFEDLIDEARFHYIVERPALREGSAAWERSKESTEVPEAFSDWVGRGTRKEEKGEAEEVEEVKEAKVEA